uniref:Uncharacterized protein n=1 Tax=Picea sitchensis TaxID=3332 RepID=A9P0Z8_PICSI|nr:unknown [Picea sitchensis]
MHRSGSVNRSLDDFSVALPVASVLPSPVKGSSIHRSYSAAAVDLLPRYKESPEDYVKKQPRFRAEQAVHLIPVALFLCGLVLWFAGEKLT